jgi:hypothetical protein
MMVVFERIRRIRKRSHANENLSELDHSRRKPIPMVLANVVSEDDELSRKQLSRKLSFTQTNSTDVSPSSSFQGSDDQQHMTAPIPNLPQHLPEIIIEEADGLDQQVQDATFFTSFDGTTGFEPNGSQVRFSHVQIRVYPIDIGDNPSCLKGVPISMEMKHSHEQTIDVNEHCRRPKRALIELKMRSLDRERMLEDAGFSFQQIHAAIRTVKVDRFRRIKTNRTLKYSQQLEVLELLKRAILNATLRRAAKKREREFLKPYKTINKPICFATTLQQEAWESPDTVETLTVDHSPPRDMPRTFRTATKDSIKFSDHSIDLNSRGTSFASVNMAGEVIESYGFQLSCSKES